MSRMAVAALAATFALGWSTPRSEAGFTQIVAFGDSLTDTGNAFNAYGIPPAPYANGRFSNGAVYLEYLAQGLGVSAPTPSSLGGTDYAYGGAGTGPGTSLLSGLAPVPNTGAQVDSYLATHPTIGAGQLFVLWAGANDFYNNGQTNPAIPVANLTAEINELYAAGARNFLVPNLPMLGNTPLDFPPGPPVTPEQRAGLNALSAGFNALLAASLGGLPASDPGIKVTQVDIAGLVNSVTANPAAYGFTDVTHSALASGRLDAAGYLFWDGVHPTTAGHLDVANLALADLGVGAVPEPGSASLLAAAGVALVAARALGVRVRAGG